VFEGMFYDFFYRVDMLLQIFAPVTGTQPQGDKDEKP
jgi:hypothetical protein